MKNYIFLALFLFPMAICAQSQKIGVRAGLNFSSFSGPLEVNETMSNSGGFHFGINYSYYFNDYFGIRTEILYNQRGTTQNYLGDTYYILRRGAERLVDYGSTDYLLSISNGYLSIPFSASVYVRPRIELFAGASLDFLISPTARGAIDYTSLNNPDGIFFIQSLEYNYYSDEAAMSSLFAAGSTVALIVDDEILTIPSVIGAYYFLEDKDGSLFNPIDISIHAGANYFLNRGFFIGASLNYGLVDPTRKEMDISLGELNPDNSFILRDDKDHQISLQVSLGFRF